MLIEGANGCGIEDPPIRFFDDVVFGGHAEEDTVGRAGDTHKLAAMLRIAKREHWDVLLVQEVMWDSRTEASATRTASVCNFEVYASRGASGHQGGSAIFICKDSQTVKVRGPARCDLQGYCDVPVWIEGTKARVV